jgi:hypothetical protein
MRLRFLILAAIAAAPCAALAEDILIVADEIPAMQNLAKQWEEKTHLTSKIVTQTEMPASLAGFKTVAVYIHKDIAEGPEHAMLDYTRNGGKLMLLHHSISSAKRKNQDWLPYFQITLPTGKFDDGGYAYFNPATFDVVNLAPHNPIATKGVHYDKKVDYQGKQLDGFEVANTEIYVNHQFDGPRTKLLGIKYTEAKSGKTIEQDSAGWMMKRDKGTVFYFMVGHKDRDFDIPPYLQILTNGLIAK